jgi:hypothetical protein
MLTKIEAHERLIPQKNLATNPDAVRRAAKARTKAKLAKKAKKKARGPMVPKVLADRMAPATVAPVAKKVTPAMFTSLSPKDEVRRFEDSPFYYGYRRRTCSGESCNGTY